MPTFRKKPVEIEAYQWDGTASAHEWIFKWTNGQAFLIPAGKLQINTLEGPIYASVGDWIIKGTADEFYPCKPDVFEEVYEFVDSPTALTERQE